MLNFRLTRVDNCANDQFVTWLDLWQLNKNDGMMESLFTLAMPEGKAMDKEIILDMLEDVGFSISDRDDSLSEIIGTPSHIEIYEMELG